MSIQPDGSFKNDQVISAIDILAEDFDRIAEDIRKASGMDCATWKFMNKHPARIMFQGLTVIRREP